MPIRCLFFYFWMKILTEGKGLSYFLLFVSISALFIFFIWGWSRIVFESRTGGERAPFCRWGWTRGQSRWSAWGRCWGGPPRPGWRWSGSDCSRCGRRPWRAAWRSFWLSSQRCWGRARRSLTGRSCRRPAGSAPTTWAGPHTRGHSQQQPSWRPFRRPSDTHT